MNEEAYEMDPGAPRDDNLYAEGDAEPFWVTLESTVADALYGIPDAEAIFDAHGCLPTVECTEEHHAEYMLGDLDLVCHIDDAVLLVAGLNAAVEAAAPAWAEAPVVV